MPLKHWPLTLQGHFFASGTSAPVSTSQMRRGVLSEARAGPRTVTSLVFLHQGHTLMSVSWDGTLKSWDVDLSKAIFTWTNLVHLQASIKMNAL
jgi:hypothetical protein